MLLQLYREFPITAAFLFPENSHYLVFFVNSTIPPGIALIETALTRDSRNTQYAVLDQAGTDVMDLLSSTGTI